MAGYSKEKDSDTATATMDDARLEAIVSQQIQLAKQYDKHDREGERAKALDYYMGRMEAYVPAEPNRSKVVSRDVADVIGWLMPQVMRVFTASDKMAMAEPVGEEDVEYARNATDGLNHVFWKDNPGYEVVYAASWDSLLVGNGIVKTYYDDTPVYTTSFHSGLNEDQVAVLLMQNENGDEPEVLAQDERMVSIADPETGMQIEAVEYDLKIRRKKSDGKFCIEAIPPEQFLIDEEAIRTDDAAFAAHWERKTRSALVQMGYDKEVVAAIPQSAPNQTPEESARREFHPHNDADASMELVDYYECFIRIDVDEDGEAELVRACFAGSENGKLLDWEVWEDEHPFDDIPCEPVPHRWAARSIADETMDVQDIKTTLIRQGLNNTYWANNPQRFVRGKVKNPEELLNPSFGGTVFGDPGTEVTDLPVPFVAQYAFDAIAYQDEVVQRRTGVGRQTMALDPDTLQNTTARADQNQRDAQYSQVELLARNMAEWGWRKVFRKLMRLMIKHQNAPRDIMMAGKPARIDPRFWNADMDVTINVGLGTGSRDRDLAMLGQILQTQVQMADRFVSLGMADEAIEMLPKILHTMTRMAESAGIRNPEEYYPEYTEERVAQLREMAAQKAQEPSPEMQLEQQRLQLEMHAKEIDMQMKREIEGAKAEQNSIKERAQMEADIATEAQRQDWEREKFDKELAFKREELNSKVQLEIWKVNSANHTPPPSQSAEVAS